MCVCLPPGGRLQYLAPPPVRNLRRRFPALTRSFSVRVHVAGLNKGGMENFMDNLPGFPDNIRPSGSGGYWVAMSAVRPNPGFSMLDFLSQRPWIKKLLFKVEARRREQLGTAAFPQGSDPARSSATSWSLVRPASSFSPSVSHLLLILRSSSVRRF